MGLIQKIIKKFSQTSIFIKIIFIVVIIGSGWFTYSKIKSNNQSESQYQTANAEKGNLIVSLSVSGSVSTNNSRTVTTTASGVVKRIFVKEGQKVSTGTPLLEIDLDLNGRQKYQSAYSSYLAAKNNLKSAQDKIYSLQSDLVSTKNVFDNQWANQSPDDPTYIQKHNAYLSAQEAYDNLQNTIKQSQTSLEASRLAYQAAGSIVYAPISGTVGSISLTPGMILNPTSDSANSNNSENKIAIVKTNATPSISVSLTEIDVPKIKVGNKVTITIDALPNKTFTGKVIAIDTTGTVSSGVVNYPTTIQLDSNMDGIMANMSVTANILTDFKDDVIMIPNSAIQNSNNETTVRIMKDRKIENIKVEIGISNDTMTEIISGVNEGDQLVTGVTNVNSSQATNGKSGSTNSPFSSFGGGMGGAGAVRIMTK